MVRWFVLTLACVVSNVTPAIGQSSLKSPPAPFRIASPAERLEIDGSKNPELIPEWYIWETFFRHLHTAGTVPSALNLSPSEERTLQMAVERYDKSTQECQKEIESLRPLVGAVPIGAVNQKQRAVQLECRRRSLDIRDRLLAGVGPDGAIALTTWVENLKGRIEVSVPKRELDHFRQPQ